MKTCRKCNETKLLDDFYKDKSKRDGRQGRCRSCEKSYKAANKDRIAEYDREYYHTNRDRIADYQHEWQQVNKDHVAVYGREYRHKYPEVYWAGGYRRRAKAHGFDPVVEDFTYADVIERYGDACAHCGGTFEELDHHPVPVASEGHHTLDNVKPSCIACNRHGAGVRTSKETKGGDA